MAKRVKDRQTLLQELRNDASKTFAYIMTGDES
jgi:hypothetical protein